MADLIAAVRTASTIKRLVERDLGQILIDADLDAASAALSGLERARDKRSVYWSTINHVESAEAKLRGRLKTGDALSSAQVLFYLSAIKALIFRYLDEEGLARKCLTDSLDIVETYNRNVQGFRVQIGYVLSFWNPTRWLASGSNVRKTADAFRPAEFWEAFGYPGPHNFSLMIFLEDGIYYWP